MRELDTLLMINENGKRKAIKKREVVAKQLVNKSLSGHLASTRMVLALQQQEHEKVAEEQRLSPINLAGVDVRDLTTEELFAVFQPDVEESIKARLEKSLRVELRKSIRAELEKSIRADLENSIGADTNGRKRRSRPKITEN